MKWLFIILTILLVLSGAWIVFALDTGATSPGTIVDDSAVGTATWLNPSNAGASDNADASFTPSGDGERSHYLKATNFGFSIPSGATINGIVVEIERSESGGFTTDEVVKIVKGGTVSGNNKADTVTAWPGTATYKTYGSSSDLWGVTLTDEDVNASTFGVVLQADISVNDGTLVTVDNIRLTVYSPEAVPTTTEIAISNGTLKISNGTLKVL